MNPIARYLYGWRMAARAVWLARGKRHGAGAILWRHAWRLAACTRWIVDGQHRRGKPPRYLRRGVIP